MIRDLGTSSYSYLTQARYEAVQAFINWISNGEHDFTAPGQELVGHNLDGTPQFVDNPITFVEVGHYYLSNMVGAPRRMNMDEQRASEERAQSYIERQLKPKGGDNVLRPVVMRWLEQDTPLMQAEADAERAAEEAAQPPPFTFTVNGHPVPSSSGHTSSNAISVGLGGTNRAHNW